MVWLSSCAAKYHGCVVCFSFLFTTRALLHPPGFPFALHPPCRLRPGTKVGYYFAWLKFYTAALVFPTVVGLLVWWTERVNSLAESSGTCVQGVCVYVCVLFFFITAVQLITIRLCSGCGGPYQYLCCFPSLLFCWCRTAVLWCGGSYQCKRCCLNDSSLLAAGERSTAAVLGWGSLPALHFARACIYAATAVLRCRGRTVRLRSAW